MRIMLTAILVSFMALEGHGQQPSAAEAIERARAATLVVPEALDTSRISPPEVTRLVNEASQEFERALGDAAARLTPEDLAQARADEASSIDAKLAVIAEDRRRRPAAYGEIFDTYIRYQPRPTQSGRAPPPATPHLTETYRLPWEFFLLTPRRADSLPGYERNAAIAIGRIGNPLSASTLMHMIRVATQPEARAEDSIERQRLALGALIGMPSTQGAEALSETLDMIAAQRQRQPQAYQDWDPVDFLVMRIDALPQAQSGVWTQFLRPFAARPETGRFVEELQFRAR